MDDYGGDDSVIVVNAVSKKFKDLMALEDVSFQVERNTIFGLLGSNGAGKSTMIHMITGLLNPSKGEINILGERVRSRYPRSLKRKVAIVPQKISLYEDLSIYDNLYFFGKAYGLTSSEVRERIASLTHTLQLGNLKRRVRFLSGGYQRRVSLAVALIGNPEILILDEATVGIDLETRKLIIDLLFRLKREKTIIITTHMMDEAEFLCDYICFMHKGRKIKEGKTKEIIQDYAQHRGSTIKVTLRNEEIAEKVTKALQKMGLLAERNGKLMIVESLSSEYDIGNLLSVMKQLGSSYAGDIMDVAIVKPSLGDIMLDLIKGIELTKDGR